MTTLTLQRDLGRTHTIPFDLRVRCTAKWWYDLSLYMMGYNLTRRLVSGDCHRQVIQQLPRTKQRFFTEMLDTVIQQAS